jgi:hypothetical protein
MPSSLVLCASLCPAALCISPDIVTKIVLSHNLHSQGFQVSSPVCCSTVAVSAATAVAAVLLLLSYDCAVRADAAVAPS